MDFMGGMSSIISLISFMIVAFGVMKIFQMATTLTEIKDLLTALKRNAPIQAQSGEEMLRALSMELDHPVPPAAIDVEHER
jgi:flagellar motor component MotA